MAKTYDVSKAREASFDVFDRNLDPDDVDATVRLAAKLAAESSFGYALDDPDYEVRRLYTWPTDPDGLSGTYYVEVRWIERYTLDGAVKREWLGEVDVRPGARSRW